MLEMKTKILVIICSVLISLNACKKDIQESIVAGNYYSDCFSESPLKNRKLTLIYYTSRNRLGGVIAESTTDANGYFKFVYEKKDKYYKIKIEDYDPVLNGKTIVESMSKFPDRTKMKVYYQNIAKVVLQTGFEKSYTDLDTLCYSFPDDTKINKLVGPFSKNQLIDSVIISSEASGKINVFWGIGIADNKKNGLLYPELYKCVSVNNMICGERAVFKFID